MVERNREFIETYCSWESDMRYIVKAVELMWARRGLTNSPVWDREAAYEAWLDEPYNPEEWARARSYFVDIRDMGSWRGSSVAKAKPRRYQKLA